MIFGAIFKDNANYLSKRFTDNFIEKYSSFYVNNKTLNDLKLVWVKNRNIPYETKDCWLSDDKNEVLVFLSGTIYNEFLNSSEVDLQPNSCKLHLIYSSFINKGPEFVNDLNGNFVIIIYESKKDKIYIFRDHLGLNPVAYKVVKDTVLFSSDIIELCHFLQEDGQINSEFFMSEFRFADLTQTPNSSVRKLLPGHYLIISNSKLEILKYWEPEKIKINHKLTKQGIYNNLKFLVEDSVRIRSDSRFKASAHVSGGLDSSVIAAMVRKEYSDQKEFFGYSWTSANFEPLGVDFDERKLIMETCEMNNIHPVFIDLKPGDYLKRSKNYIRNFGAFAEEKVLEHARKEGINLLFSGWGGDEFISKGERGINTDLLSNFNWSLFCQRNPLSQPKKFLKTLLYDILFPALNVVNFDQRKAHKRYTRYLKFPFNKNHYPSVKKFLFYRSRRQLHLGFIYHYHISGRTEASYIHGFIHGIEYRYPLLDKRIVEYMLSVPSKFLVEGKYSRMILREISKGLVPEEVTWMIKGIDPVYNANIKKNCYEATMVFINDIDEYESNPDLHFINFNLLRKDLMKFREKDNYTDEFIDNILIINNLHQFTRSYRTKDYIF